MAWECKRCGSCCRILSSHQPDSEEDRAIVKILNRGDGVCRHLQEDNTCEIYLIRPDICRVNKKDPNLEKKCKEIRKLKGVA